MSIDFKEIPQANSGTGLQDTFELFARDWLMCNGFTIVSPPGRGADAGRDLVVSEERRGNLDKSTIVNWLVSCKHFSHSGKSVGVSDEESIVDRVVANKCNGFLGFYSTLASSSLIERLHQIPNLECTALDGRQIEAKILTSPWGAVLFKRYFPLSYARWNGSEQLPAKIFSDQENVRCVSCNRDLLEEPYIGNIIQWQQILPDWKRSREIRDVYCVCKNAKCSRHLEKDRHSRGWIDTWEDVSDMIVPSIFISRLMGFVNELRSGRIYDDDAFNNTKEIYLRLFPHISRHLSDDEKSRVSSLLNLPSWLGGIGGD